MKIKKIIPYGVSDYVKMRSKDFLYIDKTKYIEILDSYGDDYVFFLRPRRFGKSLFLSMLDSYYDINTKAQFDQLFSGLYIGDHPTSYANSYYILKFDFSGIQSSERESLVSGFRRKILDGINDFKKKYQLTFELPLEEEPANLLSFFLTEVKYLIDGKIYVLIDEYDHFANDLLSFQVEVFADTISKTGFVRKWFEVLKTGTGMGVVDRIFVTGVSPITLDSLTSGFNIASNLTRDPNLNEMMGFTESEVLSLLEATVDMTDVKQLMPELKDYYNGYLFNEDVEQRVFNSDMILYYLNTYQKTKKPPKDLVDINISSDYSKMQKLFTLKNKERNYKILERILKGEPQITTITREFSLAKEFTTSDFLSLLFYMGFLTIEKEVLTRVKLKVPNYVIKELYFNFFSQMLMEPIEPKLETFEIENSIDQIALNGNLDPFIQLIEQTLEDLSNRDYLNFDEKYVKLIFITYLMLSKLYYVKSEYEANGGYIDIAFFSRNDKKEIYEGLIELKYIKKKDYEKKGDQLVVEMIEKGKNQLINYSKAKELQEKKKLIKWVLVFVGDKCVEKVLF
ncbi:MAG: AAA family ATPase [Halanaerobiales bacterium]|nr:AAA family ATPase [Halanaerobiales bacterium]